MNWYQIIPPFVSGGGAMCLFIIWFFKYKMRNNPKYKKIKYDKNGTVIEEETTYR
jgi:hypothetical protein